MTAVVDEVRRERPDGLRSKALALGSRGQQQVDAAWR